MKSRHWKKQELLAKEQHVEFEERHKKGDILNAVLRGICRRTSDSAYLCYGSSGRDFSADQEKAGESGIYRAFRVLYERMGDGERILRAE